MRAFSHCAIGSALVAGLAFAAACSNNDPSDEHVGTVGVQLQVAAGITINTVGGRIQLDDSEITGTVRGSYTGKYGELDQHWLEFRANTVGGNISVLHSVSA